MSDTEGLCKHKNILRNCYSCHLEFTYPQEKTELDTLHEKISELMVRVSKLEQYARLQADHNELQREINATLNEEIKKLQEHRKNQIDENRAVSKHLTDIDENIEWLKNSPFAKSRTYEPLFARLEKIEQGMKLWEITQSGQNKKFNEEIKNLDESYQGLFSELRFLLDKECERQIKKTKGLTFEEAIADFKSGKTIRFHDGMSESCLYKPQDGWSFGFSYNHMLGDHWEIVE